MNRIHWEQSVTLDSLEPGDRNPSSSIRDNSCVSWFLPLFSRYRRELSVASAFVVLLLILAAVAPRFFRADQLRPLVVANAPVLVAAVGMTLVILCRQIDISIGSIFSICGVVAGLLSRLGPADGDRRAGHARGRGGFGAVMARSWPGWGCRRSW